MIPCSQSDLGVEKETAPIPSRSGCTVCRASSFCSATARSCSAICAACRFMQETVEITPSPMIAIARTIRMRRGLRARRCKTKDRLMPRALVWGYARRREWALKLPRAPRLSGTREAGRPSRLSRVVDFPLDGVALRAEDARIEGGDCRMRVDSPVVPSSRVPVALFIAAGRCEAVDRCGEEGLGVVAAFREEARRGEDGRRGMGSSISMSVAPPRKPNEGECPRGASREQAGASARVP